MPTIIDSLIVQLGLDPAGFKKGEKDAAESMRKLRGDATTTSKHLEERGKVAAEFFGKVRTGAIALTGALLGAAGMKDFVVSMTTTNAALGRASRMLGMSVKELAAFQGIAEATGGSADGMAGDIKGVAREMQSLALTGKSSMLPFLYAARVDVGRFTSSTTPLREKLLLLADAFKGMDPTKAQYLGAGMGLNENTIQNLLRGRTEMEQMLAVQEKIAQVSVKDTDAAERLAKAWNSMAQAAKGSANSILTYLTPAISAFLESLTKTGLKGVTLKDIFGFGSDSATFRAASSAWSAMGFGGSPGGAASGDAGDSAFAQLLSRGEGGYNSVNGGRGGSGTADLENMTIGDVMRAQSAHQFNAAGKYQMISGTLSDAVKTLKIDPSNKFDKTTQDTIFSKYLIGIKRKEIGDYISGKSNDLQAAARAASLEWASVADPDTGRSHYDGIAGNRASISNAEIANSLRNSRAGAATTHNTSDVKIGTVTVVTQATDAVSIAKDIGPAISQHSFAAMANTGLD